MQAVHARSVFPELGTLMPLPGPLGRLTRRRRLLLGLTQPELAERVGCNQNDISRLESGKTQRINDITRIDALARALGYQDDIDFILAAYAPPALYTRWRAGVEQIEVLPLTPEGDLVALMRDWPEERKRRIVNRIMRIGPTDDELDDMMGEQM